MRRVRALPLAFSLLLLLAAGWGALVRIGWPWPPLLPPLVGAHGTLMVSGSLGTLISLERAVALRRRWGYLAPLLAALGALALLAGAPETVAAALTAAGAAALVAVLTYLARGERTLFAATMLAGAATWALGALLRAAERPVYEVVPWWSAFLVLTITGERLELSRMLRPSARARAAFVAAVALVIVGLLATLVSFDAGTRVLGAGYVAFAAWLFTNDLARRTIRSPGVTGFIAAAMLSGYAWLGASGLFSLAYDGVVGGDRYDAMLHTLFVGFVLSMVFGHAAIIVPAILGTPLLFARTFWAHLAILHAGIGLRVVGDLATSDDLRRWGALLSGVAFLVFLANMSRALRRAMAQSRRPAVGSPARSS